MGRNALLIGSDSLHPISAENHPGRESGAASIQILKGRVDALILGGPPSSIFVSAARIHRALHSGLIKQVELIRLRAMLARARESPTWEVKKHERDVKMPTSVNKAPKKYKTKPLTSMKAWKALKSHAKEIGGLHLRDLFAADPKRGESFTLEALGLFVDYSKNRITSDTVKLLTELARESELQSRIDAMFAGEKINITEGRAVLHVALRAPKGSTIVVDGQNVVPEVHVVLDRMSAFSDRVRSGEWKGQTGKRIRNVINIGIGGSDLGPVWLTKRSSL